MEQVWNVDLGIEGGDALSKSLNEFIGKVTASAGLKSTTSEQLKDETTTTTQNSVKTTFTTPTGMVGLELVPVQVFKDTQASPNFVWIIPSGASDIVTVPQDTKALTTNVYDLTKFLGTQIPSLAPRHQQRNGYDFYQMS
jgi:hypothetical protein